MLASLPWDVTGIVHEEDAALLALWYGPADCACHLAAALAEERFEDCARWHRACHHPIPQLLDRRQLGADRASLLEDTDSAEELRYVLRTLLAQWQNPFEPDNFNINHRTNRKRFWNFTLSSNAVPCLVYEGYFTN